MVSTEANRAAFIASVVEWLSEGEWDGVDLDWETPTAEDTVGLENLVKEMRGAFGGSKWGISVTL